MQDVSATYESLLASGKAWYETRLLIDDVTYDASQIFSLKIDGSVFGDSGEPALGKAIARTLSCSVRKTDQVIPTMAELKPQYRLTNGTTSSEWITKGIYYIDTRDTGHSERKLNIEAFDAMLKADAPYPGSNLSFPANDVAVVAEIAAHIGVLIDARTTAKMGNGYDSIVKLPTSYTMREVLGNIAACYAGCFFISDEGKLLLVTMDGLPDAFGLLVNEEQRNITVDGGGVIV